MSPKRPGVAKNYQIKYICFEKLENILVELVKFLKYYSK